MRLIMKRKFIIILLILITTLTMFNSLVLANENTTSNIIVKPLSYVEYDCVCYPIDGGYDCCEHKYIYNNEGILIADIITGCKATTRYLDCP